MDGASRYELFLTRFALPPFGAASLISGIMGHRVLNINADTEMLYYHDFKPNP